MTRFNPDADLVPIEQWEEIAEQKAVETGASWRILGGIIAGGVGFALSLEILGVVAGGYLCYSAYERIRKSGKDLKAVRDFGCVVHLLDEQDFRSFAKQFGDKEVYSQINFALDRKWDVSKFAINWLNTYERGNQLQSDWSKQQPQLQTQQQRNTASYSPVEEVRQLEHNFTNQPHQPIQTHVETYNPYANSSIDIVSEMTDRIQNIFGVGQGGSGKGMLLANGCRAVKAKHPDKKIFLINGKDDSKEHDYFAGVVDVEKRLHCETAKPQTVAAWFEAAIAEYDEFAAQNNGALLVIDEGTIIGARLKDARSNALNDKIIGITSCGGSMGKNIWVFAQTPFAGGSGSNLTALSQMTKVVIVRGDAIGVLAEWKRAAIFNKFDSSLVADLANNSDCNRAIYWGGSASWYSMPRLTNYSAYDRDTGKYIKDVMTPVEQLEYSLAASEQPPTIQDDYPTDDDYKLIDCITDKLADGKSDAYSYNAIRQHVVRVLPEYAKKDVIIKALDYLNKQRVIEGNESEGWVLTNN